MPASAAGSVDGLTAQSLSRLLILTRSQMTCEEGKRLCENACGNGDPPGCERLRGGCGAQKPTGRWKSCIAQCNETYSAC